MIRAAACLLLLLPSGCISFVEKANEAKAAAKLELYLPIPLVGDILPRFTMEFIGGFEWHNDAERHQHEIEKLRVQAEIQGKTQAQHESDLQKAFVDALRGTDASAAGAPTGELRDRPASRSSGG